MESPPPSTLNWTLATEEAAWEPKLGHSSVVYDGKIWVLGAKGGFNSDIVDNDVWFSSDGTNWTSATLSAAWPKRKDHTSVVFDGRMWVIGGLSVVGDFNDAWHSVDGADWTAATLAAPWEGRFGHTSVVFQGKIWVIGGQTARGASSEVWSSSDGADWELVTDSPAWEDTSLVQDQEQGRSDHTSVVFGGRIWLLGGYSGNQFSDGIRLVSDVWSSSDGVTWILETSTPPWGLRTKHTSVVFDAKIWVMGRRAVLSFLRRANDVWFSSDGATWYEATSAAVWSPRGQHTSVVFDDKMWVIGGERDVSDVWFTSAPVNGVLGWTGYP